MSRWDKLIEETEEYRRQGAVQAQLQLEGKFVFPADEVARVDLSREQWIRDVPWHDHIEEFLVCGARVRFVHLRPAAVNTGDSSDSSDLTKRSIVFLHGDGGWSYMWRKVMARLYQEGHELFALDWLGHGLSDKPTQKESMTFELHIRTLIAFINHVELNDAILVAHHWGGCIALSSIPYLPPSSCSGLFLINSFLPLRPREMSVSSHLLHGVLFLLSGILDGHVSQSRITEFMSPHISEQDLKVYGAPYQDLPASTRSSADRWARLAPGIPHFVLRRLRETPVWKWCEAVLGPRNFSALNTLALLSERDEFARRYWQKKCQGDMDNDGECMLKTVVAFGEQDLLLKDYKDILVRVIGKGNLADWAPEGIWLPTAGHYPMEDSPGDIAGLIARFPSSSDEI
ncbi:hypothetical protein ASPCAL05085 [Aspergillus calidoustus]|uniref:AB hydrolase-1 domain-containing protein n=1 Tax=Aspergillus calidoustus TaxID=454130 RepID=A0A0U5FZ56_ASPCI|nr:hypothetical protein ASPCAL05085 [Aspergillus calidoustus]